MPGPIVYDLARQQPVEPQRARWAPQQSDVKILKKMHYHHHHHLDRMINNE